MRALFVRIAVGVMVLAFVFQGQLLTASAGGTVSIPDTDIYWTWSYGDVHRTVGQPQPGWPVAFLKTDGPAMFMGAADCDTHQKYDYNWLENADPPYEWEKVADIVPGTEFCLAWQGQGFQPKDTFRGTLAWD